MKLTIDISQMAYSGTGVARYVGGMTKALLGSKVSGDITLFATAIRNRSFLNVLAAPKIVFPIPGKLVPLILGNSPINLDALFGSPDLLHTSDWVEPRTKCKKITTIHDLVFRKYPSTVDPLVLAAQTKRLKTIVEDKTFVIADSGSTKQDLMELYDIPSSRIDVIYPGIDEIYQPASNKEIESVKKKYGIVGDYLLSVGTKEPRKNLEAIVQASKGHQLVLVGRSGWGQQVKKNDHVIETGFVEDGDLPALYSGAESFVYPSLYEGFGFPIVEAMACGCPVVTSNISSMPELVGSAGVLVDPTSIDSIASGIKEAIANKAKLSSLGLAQAQKFTWTRFVEQIISTYEKVLNEK